VATDHHHHGSPAAAPAEPGYPEHPELTGAPPEGQPVHRPHQHGADVSHAGRGTMASHGGAHGGHDKHAGHSVAMFRDKFWISLLLTIPTLVWGHMLPRALGYSPPAIPGSRWIAPVLGTAVFFYGGWVFIQGAWRELRDRLPGMMTLIALAISVAFFFSAAVTLGYPGMPLWEELATLVTIMLLGHWIEMRSISQAQGALGELAKLLPSTVVRLIGDKTEEVPLSRLREGDREAAT
jgi:Cu2+-exporting ATPase